MRYGMKATVALGALAALGLGCERRERAGTEGAERGQQAATGADQAARYVADLKPLNAEAGGGASGKATLKAEGSHLVIDVEARGLPPGMHLMHYHGFTDGRDATCAGPAEDRNGDGVVDLLETEPVSGTTLVPFHQDPASLQIQTDTYPVANERGELRYQQRVPLGALTRALSEKHGIEGLALDKRVVYLHGVAEGTKLPESARSLPDVPARVTLPVACGALERVSPA